MTAAEIIQIILALGVLATTIGGVIVSVRNSNKLVEIKTTTDEVKKATDGMKTELVEVVVPPGESLPVTETKPKKPPK